MTGCVAARSYAAGLLQKFRKDFSAAPVILLGAVNLTVFEAGLQFQGLPHSDFPATTA